MVYYGPSRGCLQCRRRKVKCTWNPDSLICHTCVRRNEYCSGPRVYFGKGKQPKDLGSTDGAVTYLPEETSRQPLTTLPSGGQFGNVYLGAIRVEPAILDLVDLFRTKFLQICKSEPVTSLPRRALELGLQALSDEMQAYSMIAGLASYHARITGCSQMNVLQVQSYGRAVTVLRDAVCMTPVPARLLAATNMLIAAEFAAKNFAAVAYHMKYLVRVLAPNSSPMPPTLVRLRHTVMVLELERATATFSRPLMDISIWASNDRCYGPWPDTVVYDWPQEVMDTVAISDLRLLGLFHQLRFYDAILRDPWLCDSIDQGYAYQMSWRCLDLSNQLLNYALDSSSTSQGRFDQSQRAAAALAALFLFRLRTRTECAGHLNSKTQQTMMERCWAVGPQILTQIRALLEQSATSALTLRVHGVCPELRLRLWILYVGAMIEETAEFDQGRPDYCTRALEDLVIALDLKPFLLQQHLESIFVLHRVKGEVSGPRWLTPELRTWGFPNWNGEILAMRHTSV